MVKKISLNEFKLLASNSNWIRESDFDTGDSATREDFDGYDENGNEISKEITSVWGSAWVESSLDGVVITYCEGWQYEAFDSDSFKTCTDGIDDVWKITGVVVVDEDGEKVSIYDLVHDLPEAFKEIDYSALVGSIEQIDEIDMGSDMETFEIKIDNSPNIKFTGELIASASSSANNASSYYSGSVGRWTELSLYKTAGGKFICHQIGHTQWQGEKTRYSGKICATEAEVIEFFGHRWLAKDLYESAGITDAVVVE